MSKIKPRTDKPPKLKSVKKKKYKPQYYGSQKLKDKGAWKAFSLYIRARDRKCVTCGSPRNLAAGHYIPGSICGKTLFFSETNVNAQCSFYCNGIKHGNLDSYALYLTRKHGKDILETLDQIRREEKEKGIICRFTKEELKEIELKYSSLLTSITIDI